MSTPMLASISSLVVVALPLLVTNILKTPVPPGSAVFVVHLRRQPTKTGEPVEREERRPEGGVAGGEVRAR